MTMRMPPAPFCQSCGRPLEGEADSGTNRGGTRSNEFCGLCYADGEFVDPDLTNAEMAERAARAMAAERDMPLEAARAMVEGFIDHLSRWSHRAEDEAAMMVGSVNREA